MIANSFTKFLSVIKHKHFIEIIKIENKKKLLASIKWEDDLKNAFQQQKANIYKLFGFKIAAF